MYLPESCWIFFVRNFKCTRTLNKKEGVHLSETPLINVFGLTVGLNVFLSLIGTVIVVGLLAFVAGRNLSTDHPGRGQMAVEYFVDFIDSIIKANLGSAYDSTYVWIAMTLFLFVFVANLLGLPFLVEAQEVSFWKSPTADPVVAFSLAIIVNLISHVLGIRKKGFGRYFKETYFSPILSFPVTLAEEVMNFFTLAMRLFGNIFAGEILLALIAQFGNSLGLFSWLGGIPMQMIWQGFSIFIGGIQAYIFVTLSTVYLKDKVSTEEEGE